MTEELQDDEINLLEYWNVIWRRKTMIIVVCSVAVIATMIQSLLSPKFYKSETVIMSTGSEAGGLGAAISALPFAGALGGAAGQTSVDKLMVILKSRTVAYDVIRRFDLMKVFNEKAWDTAKGAWINPEKPPFLEDAVNFLNTGVTNVSKSKEGAITISVEWKDKQLASDIANYYVTALTDFLKDKSVNITVQVVDKAVPVERKSRPKIRQNMMLAGVASIFVSIFIAFALEYLSKQKKLRA